MTRTKIVPRPHHVSLLLSDEEKTALTAVAAHRQRTQNDVIRHLIAEAAAALAPARAAKKGARA